MNGQYMHLSSSWKIRPPSDQPFSWTRLRVSGFHLHANAKHSSLPPCLSGPYYFRLCPCMSIRPQFRTFPNLNWRFSKSGNIFLEEFSMQTNIKQHISASTIPISIASEDWSKISAKRLTHDQYFTVVLVFILRSHGGEH